MQQRALKNAKIEVVWSHVADEVLGNDQNGVTGVRLNNTKDGTLRELQVVGMFVPMDTRKPRHTRQTGDERKGYIRWTKLFRTYTSVEAVFAAGDVADDYTRRSLPPARVAWPRWTPNATWQLTDTKMAQEISRPKDERRTAISRRAFLAQLTTGGRLDGRRSLGSILTAAEPKPASGSWNGKYSICNETFPDWPQGKIFQFAADCGYRGVEIAPFTIDPDVRKDLRRDEGAAAAAR